MWPRHQPAASAFALMIGLVVAFVAAGPYFVPVAAQSHDDAARRLREAEGALARERAQQRETAREARAAAEALRRAEAERAAAIAAWRRAEAEAAGIAGRLDAADAARASATALLAAHARELAPLLPAMQRLALFPAETLLAGPGTPAERLAVFALLRGMASRLAAGARAHAEAAEQAEATRREVETENRALLAALGTAREQAEALDAAVAAARALRGEADVAETAQARRVAAAAAGAADLRALVGRLDAAPRQHEAAPAAPAAPAAAAPPAGRGVGVRNGSLAWPVHGSIVRPQAEAGDQAPAPRLAIAAAPEARVLAPCAGRVAYAAPFRSLGPLLILDCGGGYHVVLAGLERLDAAVGQAVRQGDPVGTLPNLDPRSGRRVILNMELRRAGRALDPEPYLSRQQDRIGG
ncbi:MAG: peptidoglycan DD-metalloendopeptidase family protein [Acetobacteraceae bacterium]|nr:peptidoglycan DD-metalloendopeptidase family protein [Acetobacteraceae bacterium]